MKQLLVSTVLGLCTCLSSTAWSYNAEMAQSYARLFADVSGAQAGKALHFISPESFIADMKKGKEYVAIDVRTPAETELFTLSLPGRLVIPTSQIFTPEKLGMIPTDKSVVIICKSGARATAVGTSLRHIGFNNVYILKGGFQGLASYYGPKQAYSKPDQSSSE
jgi:rhodanese-related sulfurtransferase